VEEFIINKISPKQELALSLTFLCTEGSFIVFCSVTVNIKYPRRVAVEGERGEERGREG